MALHLAFLTDITEHLNILNFKQHGQYVIELREEIEKRLADFDNMKTIFQLFADPMAVTIEGDQDPELQMELQWNFVMSDKYPKLHNFALNVTSVFGSTYICECAFSTMKMFKSKQRNRLSQEALKSNLHIVTTEMEADIIALVNEHTAQCSH
ncbi:hypothetical protein PR048_025833 [Dryococelus australis]|uniref:HAT C-terminal dimerisation domain-containing protein n=1 Tax=Dryococelus australis TaxID=614101 RepID=A0ABQ9GJM1_9NEOP|nr:hypothetical protein PR048_025833 [Dryococelus australis]